MPATQLGMLGVGDESRRTPVRKKKVESTPSPSSSFVPNQKLPVHRWFRYSAGFSGEWAEAEIRERTRPGAVVLDPFAGVGTTLIAARASGRTGVGVEAHPFVARLAEAKLEWGFDAWAFEKAARRVVERARKARPGPSVQDEPTLLAAAFTPAALRDLRSLKDAIENSAEESSPERRLLWLALVAILRACSGAGTAPWQYVLPKKTKARVADPLEQFEAQAALMAADMAQLQGRAASGTAKLIRGDARECSGVETGSVDLVVTSPPYPNNYDYADATRLEQTFLGELRGWGDLQELSRRFLVRACSQHTAAERLKLDALLAEPVLEPIRSELSEVCAQLAAVRETKGGKKTYHTMVAAYFLDMAKVWNALGRVVRPRGQVGFVVGDSAPYGVYVPVDVWFQRLAEEAGFTFREFREVRKRNIKWKNRKHRVPLREGEMWLVKRG